MREVMHPIYGLIAVASIYISENGLWSAYTHASMSHSQPVSVPFPDLLHSLFMHNFLEYESCVM